MQKLKKISTLFLALMLFVFPVIFASIYPASAFAVSVTEGSGSAQVVVFQNAGGSVKIEGSAAAVLYDALTVTEEVVEPGVFAKVGKSYMCVKGNRTESLPSYSCGIPISDEKNGQGY